MKIDLPSNFAAFLFDKTTTKRSKNGNDYKNTIGIQLPVKLY